MKEFFSYKSVLTALCALAVWLGISIAAPMLNLPYEVLQFVQMTPAVLWKIFLPFLFLNAILQWTGRDMIAQTFMIYAGAVIGGLIIAASLYEVYAFLVLQSGISLVDELYRVMMGVVFVIFSALNERATR